MGEYAKYYGTEIKIGTCSSMYYLRYEDRGKITPLSGNVDPRTDKGLLYRLPFPDEDNVGPGNYQPFLRGYRLWKKDSEGYGVDFSDPELTEDPGSVQLKHDCGLLISVPCYHGVKLPELGPDTHVHWNGKSWFLELIFVKEMEDGSVKPIIHCRHCRHMWHYDWDDIKDYIHTDMEERLSKHWD